jgi:hypothetical protein
VRFVLIPFLLGCALLQAGEVRELRIKIQPDHPVAEFDPCKVLGGGIDGHWQGETGRMFTPDHVREMLAAGLNPLSVRLRTELAIDAWHWNPKGNWSDPAHHQGYWLSDAKPDASRPILFSYGYKLPRRGNTLDEANDDGYSMLDDGNDATFWKSNPYLCAPYTGEPDPAHPQWVILDFGKEVPINTVRIQWAEPYARKFTVESANKGRVYFGGHPGGLFSRVWKRFPHGKVEAGSGGDQLLRLSDQSVSARYLRIWMTEGSGTAPAQATDPRDHLGFAIREISAGYTDEKGIFHDEVTHAPGKTQTLTYASSTDPWHRAGDLDPKVEQPGIDLIARCGITRGLPAMLSIPVFYDTPENTAALAAYVERSRFPVGRYELGEEPDGQRVAPGDFGALYAQAARGIRKVAPHGTLGGPSFVTVDVDRKDDQTYRFDKRWWIRDFLTELSRQQARRDFQFLSFEWYPFDDVEGKEETQIPTAYGMLRRAMDRLRPLGLPLVIGEANYSVFPCRQEVDLGGALLNAEIAAQFLTSGGSADFFYSYEPNQLEESSGSWGNQMMLMQSQRRSSGSSGVPLATFHALRMLTREWMAPSGGLHEVFAVTTDLPKQDQCFLSVFALRRPDHSWSLLLINKSADQSLRLTGIFARPDSPFGNAGRRLTTYSAEQYAWFADGKEGYPIRNLPPEHHNIAGKQPIVILPWSISILRSFPIAGKTN